MWLVFSKKLNYVNNFFKIIFRNERRLINFGFQVNLAAQISLVNSAADPAQNIPLFSRHFYRQ